MYTVCIVSVIARTAHIHHEWRKTVHQKKKIKWTEAFSEGITSAWILDQKYISTHNFHFTSAWKYIFFISNNDDKMCWDQRNCSSLPLILCYTCEKNKCNNEKSVFYIFGSYESNATIYIRESRSCYAKMQCRTLFSQHPLFNIQPLNSFFLLLMWAHVPRACSKQGKSQKERREQGEAVYLNIWLLPFKRLNIKFQLTFQLSETFLAINHDIICKLKILCASVHKKNRIVFSKFFFAFSCVFYIHPMHLTRAFRYGLLHCAIKKWKLRRKCQILRGKNVTSNV